MGKVMMRMNKRKCTKGLFFMVVGLLLIAAALALVFYNLWDADRAEKASAEIVKKLEQAIQDEKPEKEPEFSGFEDAYREMQTEEIDGYLYIGVLELPSLGLKLPVMASWDYERLKISPCRYTGSYYLDDLVICAHNYAKHFSPIKWIEPGADVFFTTVEGTVYHYQVTNRETVPGTAVEKMIDQTGEEWDLTLFTCNTGGQTRCAVRCIRVR